MMPPRTRNVFKINVALNSHAGDAVPPTWLASRQEQAGWDQEMTIPTTGLQSRPPRRQAAHDGDGELRLQAERGNVASLQGSHRSISSWGAAECRQAANRKRRPHSRRVELRVEYVSVATESALVCSACFRFPVATIPEESHRSKGTVDFVSNDNGRTARASRMC